MQPSENGGLSTGEILELLRLEGPLTRAELGQRTGLSRTTVTQRLEQLGAAGLVTEQNGRTDRGRPPGRVAFNAAAGAVIAVDLDDTGARIAVTDLSGDVLAEGAVAVDVADGPDVVLVELQPACARLLRATGLSRRDLWGVGIGVPGPVEVATGRLVAPAGMPGWADVPVADAMGKRFGVPVVVDNDVRLMAAGETSQWETPRPDLVVVKLSMGVGCAVVSSGAVLRGTRGAAGEIGHVPVAGGHRPCRCGNIGCLETVAAGWALVERLRRNGHTADGIGDIATAVARGEPEALAGVREAGRALGEVVAAVVNVLNPEAVIVGGPLAENGEILLTGVRQAVYQRITPLAARGLDMRASTLGERAGVLGGAQLVLDRVRAPEWIDQLVGAGGPRAARSARSA